MDSLIITPHLLAGLKDAANRFRQRRFKTTVRVKNPLTGFRDLSQWSQLRQQLQLCRQSD